MTTRRRGKSGFGESHRRTDKAGHTQRKQFGLTTRAERIQVHLSWAVAALDDDEAAPRLEQKRRGRELATRDPQDAP